MSTVSYVSDTKKSIERYWKMKMNIKKHNKILAIVVSLSIAIGSYFTPINANEIKPSAIGHVDTKLFDLDVNEHLEIIPLVEDESVVNLDYTTDNFRAIFTLKNFSVTRIDYLDYSDGKIFSKTFFDSQSIAPLSSQERIDLTMMVHNISVESGWVVSEYVNPSFDSNFERVSSSELSTESASLVNPMSSYYNAVLSSFNLYAGNNYYSLLRSTQGYKGHTGRVYETATNQVSRCWNLDSIFNPKTALSVIILYLDLPIQTVKTAISYVIGVYGILESLYTNEVQDWNGTKYYQKNVEVDSRSITWKSFAELKTKAILLTDPIKGASTKWTHIEKVYFDGQSVYNDNTGLIIKGVDNFINLGY